MQIFLVILGFVLLVIFLLEACLRFSVLWHSPLSLKIGYALFLVSPKVVEEYMVINQRIKRGGFKNQEALLKHYAAISGRNYNEIERSTSRSG